MCVQWVVVSFDNFELVGAKDDDDEDEDDWWWTESDLSDDIWYLRVFAMKRRKTNENKEKHD